MLTRTAWPSCGTKASSMGLSILITGAEAEMANHMKGRRNTGKCGHLSSTQRVGECRTIKLSPFWGEGQTLYRSAGLLQTSILKAVHFTICLYFCMPRHVRVCWNTTSTVMCDNCHRSSCHKVLNPWLTLCFGVRTDAPRGQFRLHRWQQM